MRSDCRSNRLRVRGQRARAKVRDTDVCSSVWDDPVARAIRYIEAHLSSNFSLEVAAEAAAYRAVLATASARAARRKDGR